MKLDVIIPVYNEDENIILLLKKLEKEIICNFRVLICYDNENDSTLKYLKDTNFSNYNFYVLEGASYVDEFGYDNELQKLADNNKNVTFEASISRPLEDRNKNWQGLKGRVNNVLEERIKSWNVKPSESIVYACGHPGMIEDVKEKLKDSDFTFLEERFWKD